MSCCSLLPYSNLIALSILGCLHDLIWPAALFKKIKRSQLTVKRFQGSVTASATATLVHAFVANRLDYCFSLYAGLPVCRLACLDRVLRSAARLIGVIPKFGHVSKYMIDVLRWLPAEQRISYRIASIVWRCLLGLLFTFVSSVVLSIVL